MAIGDAMFLERLYAAEDRVREQASGFDDKASYLLIILTFLAEFVEHLKFSGMLLDGVAVAICVSALCAILELAMVRYQEEDAVFYAEYRKETRVSNPGRTDAVIESAMRQGMMQSAKARIRHNERINRVKGRLLVGSYSTMLIALLMAIGKMALS